MELIDIIITTLSFVLVALLVILLLSFIFYKMKNKDQYLLIPNRNEEEELNEVTKKMREVIKPRKPQRYKVVNENIIIPATRIQKDKINISEKFEVYNYIPARELPSRQRPKFTKWSE